MFSKDISDLKLRLEIGQIHINQLLKYYLKIDLILSFIPANEFVKRKISATVKEVMQGIVKMYLNK